MGSLSALAVDVLGTAVAIRAPDAVLAELRRALVDLPARPDADRLVVLSEADGDLSLHDGDRLVRSGIAPAVAAATVVWHLNAIATASAAHLVVHAGAVVGPSGGAVLLPGRSGAGKSTITAACVTAGLAYLSDELAALDPTTGRIVPYPRPLALEGERLVASSALGGGPVAEPTPPAALVFPRYERDQQDLVEVPLDPGWALIALAAHAPNLSAFGGVGLAWLAGLALACPARQVTHGAVAPVVDLVRELARRPAQPLAAAPVLTPITATTTSVALGDDLAVLDHRTGQVHLLNPSAARVWCAAAVAGGDDPAALTASAVTELERDGHAPLAHREVSATLDHLVRSGLLPGLPG